jgi:predicted MFS family arabinose efflux permease
VVLFTSLYPPKDVIRATALLTVINTLGRIIGSASTGFLNDLGGYPLAFYCSIGAAGLGIVILMFIKEKRTPSQPPSFKKLKRLFVRRDVFVPALLDTVLHYGDWTASFTFIPLLAAQFGAGNVALSALGTLNLGMVLLGNALSTALANRLGPKKLLVISFVIQASGMVGAALAPSLVVVFAAQVLVGMAFGIGYPILMGLSIKKVDHSEQNSAMGLHQSLYALGMFTGPWLSGLLAKALGIQPMFGIIAGAILVAGLLGERLLRE